MQIKKPEGLQQKQKEGNNVKKEKREIMIK